MEDDRTQDVIVVAEAAAHVSPHVESHVHMYGFKLDLSRIDCN